jgi:putative transposase
MEAARYLGETVGIQPACAAIGINRSRFYRFRTRQIAPVKSPVRPRPPLSLSDLERQETLDVLRSERFLDQAPPVVYSTLLEEGRYLCSVRTMYRILADEDEVRERRNQKRHPHYEKPELLATKPNEVWSWDITKLKGPEKWTYYYLYVILDIFSRFVVGWMIATRESAELAKRLIEDTCVKQDIQRDQLTVHSDRGSSMKSKSVAFLLADLGVTKTHSRPYVSNDNPYSEAWFKTLKYRPNFPGRFGSIEDARHHCQGFFGWYNGKHRHSGIAMLTPQTLHYGESDQVIKVRSETLAAAFEANPQRFKGKRPVAKRPPEAVWINPPKPKLSTIVASPDGIVIESMVPGETEAGSAGEHPAKG